MTPRRQFAPISIGQTSIAPGKLALIAGPCVLEDGGMAEEVAHELKRITTELDIPFVFKASYSKANRTSRESYRGPGSREGLRAIARIRERVGVPVTSDVHETVEVTPAAETLDLLQIPAFLCRQTPLIEAAARSGKPIHLKKGQFLDPASMAHCVEKAHAAGAQGVIVTERGTTFGYGDLVVDFRSIGVLGGLGCPIFFDATHSVQKPGGAETGGQREFVPLLARAAIAAGADGLFIETHPNPEQARSDRDSQWPLAELPALLRSLMKIHQAITDMSLVETRRL